LGRVPASGTVARRLFVCHNRNAGHSGRKERSMEVTMRKVDEIKPYEKNPRLNDGAIDAVARSIQEFGFRQPIVVDSQDVIIVGHSRWRAAKKLGLLEVPVHVARDLTPEKIRAYRIADNQTNTLAEWDYKLLNLEMRDLQEANYDLGSLAFDADQLEKILNPDGRTGLTDPDAVPEPPAVPVTKKGDLWLLGAFTTCPHCGEVNEL
jgi:ParB-like chromosome segregation protein Spo0J